MTPEAAERAYGPCPQCGSRAIGMRYHDAQPHCSNCRRDDIEPPSCRYIDCDRGYEPHLRVACQQCGYHWFEVPAAYALAGRSTERGDGE